MGHQEGLSHLAGVEGNTGQGRARAVVAMGESLWGEQDAAGVGDMPPLPVQPQERLLSSQDQRRSKGTAVSDHRPDSLQTVLFHWRNFQ